MEIKCDYCGKKFSKISEYVYHKEKRELQCPFWGGDSNRKPPKGVKNI